MAAHLTIDTLCNLQEDPCYKLQKKEEKRANNAPSTALANISQEGELRKRIGKKTSIRYAAQQQTIGDTEATRSRAVDYPFN